MYMDGSGLVQRSVYTDGAEIPPLASYDRFPTEPSSQPISEVPPYQAFNDVEPFLRPGGAASAQLAAATTVQPMSGPVTTPTTSGKSSYDVLCVALSLLASSEGL